MVSSVWELEHMLQREGATKVMALRMKHLPICSVSPLVVMCLALGVSFLPGWE